MKVKRVKWLILLFGLMVLTAPLLIYQRQVQNAKDQALIEAIERDDAQAVLILLEQGANPNTHKWYSDLRSSWQVMLDRARGYTGRYELPALRLALLTHENPLIVQALLDHQADVNGRASNGMTPLMTAAWKCNPCFVRLLLERGANPRLKDFGGIPLPGFINAGLSGTLSQNSVFDYLNGSFKPDREEHIEVVQLLQNAGAK